MTKPFNLDALRIDGPQLEELAKGQKVDGKRVPPRPGKWRRKFIRVPWLWIEAMKDVKSGAPFRLAMFILYEHWKGGGRPVKLANVALAGVGVDQVKKQRALRTLERLGLVTVERKTRQAPLVTPRFLSE